MRSCDKTNGTLEETGRGWCVLLSKAYDCGIGANIELVVAIKASTQMTVGHDKDESAVDVNSSV